MIARAIPMFPSASRMTRACVAGEAGPDHRKVFSVDVVVNGDVLGSATGKAKKEAEQEAARLALEKLGGS